MTESKITQPGFDLFICDHRQGSHGDSTQYNVWVNPEGYESEMGFCWACPDHRCGEGTVDRASGVFTPRRVIDYEYPPPWPTR
ncbi:hypothetical protein COV53_01875 [Candidatus Gottesmanbacteria bacterium CG11_big_fil_rev_8_21_14_0_20_37_11]|uniref:Uncharacterized protein n=2 Tax=Candidatus Gottesmaniibacteriota TaxID=1752720 RepID=A0A2M7RPG0_9BACT|nr:MAG: hypothetical protein COX23_03050 [Candidatus Gottesmanbacteria bacterium CG23_combo_of_CG06-09_8_20_14_all_37_19]PIR08656.1 MAG: hypothetical protein COV53_01875 [Candidatus Gottesmanbacteria bacterium CG11_big_fil_rev_8_21_14_0_20_37_11]PIZ02221.1 MAG: hypothetical protein COY59_05990 [Candidatus Gottesmanbacteria bacterium CG_4_10_14_0_8_um_filter_37_24]